MENDEQFSETLNSSKNSEENSILSGITYGIFDSERGNHCQKPPIFKEIHQQKQPQIKRDQ